MDWIWRGLKNGGPSGSVAAADVAQYLDQAARHVDIVVDYLWGVWSGPAVSGGCRFDPVQAGHPQHLCRASARHSLTRTIDELHDGTNSWLLVFNGTSGTNSQCVAANNAGTKVEVEPCFGSNGVLWTRVATSHADAYKWVNQAASKTMGTNFELTGLKDKGQYVLKADGLNGGYQVFIIG